MRISALLHQYLRGNKHRNTFESLLKELTKKEEKKRNMKVAATRYTSIP